MGIHISCDGCYKTVKDMQEYATLTLTSNNPRFPLKASFIYCIPCMKSHERLYTSVENPNYVPPPKEVSDESKSAG